MGLSLKSIMDWCQKDIEENIELHEISAKKSYEYLETSTAKYKGKTVYSLYVPKLLLPESVDFLKQVAETMATIMRKVIKEYLEKEDYRKLFSFDKKTEELILHHPGYENLLPVCRVDIFWNEEDNSFQFCELNTDGSSAMNEDRELCIAFEKTHLYKQLRENYEISSFELFDSLVQGFMENYKTYENAVEDPVVAIVDFLELGCSMEEFEQFKRSFEKAGYETHICDIRDLCYNGHVLCTPEGKQIDLVYRRAVTSDVVEHAHEVQAFIQAVTEKHVCCMGSFCTQIVHDKSLFYILHMDRTLEFLTDKEQEFVKNHIPFTRELTKDEVEKNNVLKEKDKWLLKPQNSYGARGIYAGIRMKKAEWEQAVKEHTDKGYIFQKFIMPYQTFNADFHKIPELREYSNLTGLYVYNGKFAGVYSRQSKCEIISGLYDENDIATIRLKKL